MIASSLYSESVLGVDWTGRSRPALAEEWHWEDEAHTLVLRLRPGVKFHDGTPVLASSVVGALERYRKLTIHPTSGTRHISSIQAVDDGTVAIRLSRPDSFLVPELGQVTVEGSDGSGTGPFRIVSTDEPMRLERFEEYRLGPSAIRAITIQPYESQRSAWAALLREEIDAVQEVLPDSVEFMEGSTRIHTFSQVRPYYIMLAFNLRQVVLRSAEVRRALSEGIDRDEIVRDALRGRARVAENPIWPDHWALSAAARRYSYNPDAARLRLEAAGYPMRGNATTGPSRLAFECLFWNEDPQYERMALLLQRQLLRLGVDLRLTGLPLGNLVNRAGSGKFEVMLLPVRGGRSLDVTYEYWRSPETAEALRLNLGYTGADAILDRIRAASSDADIRLGVAELQERFYEDAPAMFLAWQQTTRAVSSKIDVSDRTDPDIFWTIWRWRRAEPGRSP